MSLSTEVSFIEEVGAAALSLVMDGNFVLAQRALGKIRNSPFVTESERVIAVVEARILQQKGKLEEARARILKSIGFVWGSRVAFEILSALNPQTDSTSREYHLEILGGKACIAGFLNFTDNHIASFDVVANSRDEALGYIETICQFKDKHGMIILVYKERDIDLGVSKRRGIAQTYPFRIFEKGHT